MQAMRSLPSGGRLAMVLQLLASGGLHLVVRLEAPRVSARTRSVLRIIGSGGLSLLLSDYQISSAAQ